jgi:hypothetical protein
MELTEGYKNISVKENILLKDVCPNDKLIRIRKRETKISCDLITREELIILRVRTIKFANSPPRACHGSTGQKP